MQLSQVHLRGTRAIQPAANTVATGTLYFVTDESALEEAVGGSWVTYGGGVSTHSALTGLSADDHAQYLLASDATNRATFATNWTDLTDTGTTTLHTHSSSVESLDLSLESGDLSTEPWERIYSDGGVRPYRWTPVYNISLGAGNASFSSLGGDFTNGWTFYADHAIVVTGASIGAPVGMNGKALKVSVWSRGSTIGGTAVLQGSFTIASLVTGINTGAFSTNLTLPAGYHTIGQYITDASNYLLITGVNTTGAWFDAHIHQNFDSVHYLHSNFSAGDTAPDSTYYAGELYVIDIHYAPING